jgi:RNA recognition motif-containing protein
LFGQEITVRLEGRKWWKKWKNPEMSPTPRSNIYIDRPQPRCYDTFLRLSVRNLPPSVERFQLREFFSKHGKVSSAMVACKNSKKIGLITIAMEEERADALAYLNGLASACIYIGAYLINSVMRQSHVFHYCVRIDECNFFPYICRFLTDALLT